jgi:hypothetical protein
MNTQLIFLLKVLRKLNRKYLAKKPQKPESIQDPDMASQIIYDMLIKDEPCMIARFGSTELSCLRNYLGIKAKGKNVLGFIKDTDPAWWWEENIINQMQNWSGFFPPTVPKIEQLCKLMLADISELDLLGSWIPSEDIVADKIKDTVKISLPLLEPYTSSNPWSRALKGKKVLVVHPFASLIEAQYQNREHLFDNPNVLPEFDLKVISAVQSLGGVNNDFADWFEALQWMKDEIDSHDYDICLLGCGAYGFHLAAHVKRTGKKAFHLGGALQLLFGIKGNRWEVPSYPSLWNLPDNLYLDMFKNKYWVKPSAKFKPAIANKVENACYW